MQSKNNRVIIAAAGGRKTTFIVEDALSQSVNKRVLITTYTLENLDQIENYIIEKNGCLPSNISIISWFSFLLIDGVRPYQSFVTGDKKVKSIDFESRPSRYIPKTSLAYYINSANNLYRDRISDLVCKICKHSDNLVISRLEDIYDVIYVDEMQDLSGWDYNFIELLLNSLIDITLVGDPRQSTYTTTNSMKNKGIVGGNMLVWIKKLEKKGLCKFEERTECFRSNQEICDFADELFPKLSKTFSKEVVATHHDGIFFIKPEELEEYKIKYRPVILRWDRNSDTLGHMAINIGVSKGKTYPRIVIFPTSTMTQYLKKKNPAELKPRTRSKLYVAVTRARFSVGFVVN